MTKHEPPFQLLEEDLVKLFHHSKNRPDIWDYCWSVLKTFFSFIFLFILFFAIVNMPAYSAKVGYFWHTYILGEKISNSSGNNLRLLEPIAKNSSLVESRDITITPNGDKLNEFLKINVLKDHLLIPSININAPIIWRSPVENTIENLKNGVAHYAGTALPGENGNVFITGHSSNYWWDPGRFKQVFVLLDKLKIGDRIYINYNDQPYVYQVENIKVIKPAQIEVLNPADHSILSLMTCTPVGTTINRLIVQSKQIYPEQSDGTPKSPFKPKLLPAIR